MKSTQVNSFAGFCFVTLSEVYNSMQSLTAAASHMFKRQNHTENMTYFPSRRSLSLI